MSNKKLYLVESFGKLSILIFREFFGFKVYVTDNKLMLEIPLLLERYIIIDALKRLRKITNEIDNLEYFKMVVIGSLYISMKY